MSHGGSEEPDLTAMLDVVMQLLMYFILTAKLTGEATNVEIQLPYSQAAKVGVQGGGEDFIFLNLNAKGEVLTPGKAAMGIQNGEAKLWLSNRAQEIRAANGGQKITTAIILRADLRANYADVFRVLQTCKETGFRRFKVRAMVRS
jgi:biopolymer transport protein ExbD